MKPPHPSRLFRSFRIIAGAVLWFTAGLAAAGSYTIDQGAWQQPRSAAMVKSLPPVQAAVQEWQGKAAARLVIQHQDDEEGALWGAELRDWLVSLGVPPASIHLAAGEVAPAALRLEVHSP